MAQGWPWPPHPDFKFLDMGLAQRKSSFKFVFHDITHILVLLRIIISCSHCRRLPLRLPDRLITRTEWKFHDCNSWLKLVLLKLFSRLISVRNRDSSKAWPTNPRQILFRWQAPFLHNDRRILFLAMEICKREVRVRRLLWVFGSVTIFVALISGSLTGDEA